MKYKDALVRVLIFQAVFLLISFFTTSLFLYVINFILNIIAIILAIISVSIKEK